MTHGRKRLVVLMSSLAIAATCGLVPSSPAQAQPNIKDVQAKVDALYRQAEQASERYNNAKIQLAQLKQDVGGLQADEQRQDTALERVRDDVKSSILRQYTGGNLNAFNSVLSSQDSTSFLSQMSTMSSYDQIENGLYADYQTGLKALDIRHEATSNRLAQVTSTEAELKSDKQTVDAKLADAKQLLGHLQDEQRQEILSRGDVRTPADVPVSGRATAAVQYALAQVGKSYVYGAAGPDAFDCSGLTMMAWAQAGVALPHSSSAQYSSGTHIAASDLQPGDLVFYYSPISHVGMYIGNGLIVNAENPSVGVTVTGLYSMPYVGAVRPG